MGLRTLAAGVLASVALLGCASVEPRIALLAYLTLLSAKPISTMAGHARRERLLELAPRLKEAELPRTLDHLVLLSSAWMLCSYAERRDKHAIKPILNRVLRTWMLAGGMSDAELPAQRRMVERPTLLVAAEIMHSNHVQYRYFGQYLRQLRTRFRLVLLTEENQIDEHVPLVLGQDRHVAGLPNPDLLVGKLHLGAGPAPGWTQQHLAILHLVHLLPSMSLSRSM